ncbi:MAG: DUF362 domain-containing protein [Candidatus Hodarchaeales archaeon]
MLKARYVEWVKDNCNFCEACRIICPENAITINDRILIIQKVKCSDCLNCIEECPSEALILID